MLNLYQCLLMITHDPHFIHVPHPFTHDPFYSRHRWFIERYLKPTTTTSGSQWFKLLVSLLDTAVVGRSSTITDHKPWHINEKLYLVPVTDQLEKPYVLCTLCHYIIIQFSKWAKIFPYIYKTNFEEVNYYINFKFWAH